MAPLGATGAAGSQVLRVLMSTQPAHTQIKLLVRSRHRLLYLVPDIGTNKNVHVLEGQIDDIAIVPVCIANTDAILLSIGRNENEEQPRLIRPIFWENGKKTRYRRESRLMWSGRVTTLILDSRRQEPREQLLYLDLTL